MQHLNIQSVIEKKNSAMVFKQIANTILPKSIRMVEDTPHNHSNGYLPILDTEMKAANGRFTHRHYAKPMASVEVVNAKSAMSLGSKVAILTQEGNRTLRNCDPNMLWSEKVPYLNKLMISMLWSCDSEKTSELVATKILVSYNHNIRNFK